MKTTNIKTFSIAELKHALIQMIDLRLKSYNVQGMTLTKEQVTELIDDHVEIQEWRNIAVFSEEMDQSEMFCTMIDSKTIEYSTMMDADSIYTNTWEFKTIMN